MGSDSMVAKSLSLPTPDALVMEALPLWYTFGAQLGMPRHAKKTNTLTTAIKKIKTIHCNDTAMT